MALGNINECPNCNFSMKLTKAPYIYHGSYIGLLEAYVCNFCNRVYFTENAYHEIMAVPTSLEDFKPFEEQVPISIKQENSLPSFLELRTISDSDKNRESTNEEYLINPRKAYRRSKAILLQIIQRVWNVE